MSARNLCRPNAPASASAASSIRRPPSALRGAPGSRGRVAAAAKAHVSVSLVFAHGDAVHAEGSSASEEALSRQLDRDTAGERMSLRSRRSSVATIASMRTDYTSSHPLSLPLPEEDEPVAGPSRSPHPHNLHLDPTSSATLPAAPDDQPSTPRIRRRRASSRSRSYRHESHDTASARKGSACEMSDAGVERARTPQPSPRLNPKQSGAWLRWNSPAPSFPRKDKGKARDDSPNTATSDVEAANVDADPQSRAPLPVPAPPAATGAQDDELHTVSSLLPSQPHPSSSLSTTNDEPPQPPEPKTPEPKSPSMQPTGPPPKLTPTNGWRYYFWGSGGGDGASMPTPHLAPPPSQPAAAATPAAAADEPPHTNVEACASAVTNGSANGSAKQRIVEDVNLADAAGSTSHAAAPAASAPPSPRTSIAADPRSSANAASSKAPAPSAGPGLPKPSKAHASSKDSAPSKPAAPPSLSETKPPASSVNALSATPPVEGSLLPPAEITTALTPVEPTDGQGAPPASTSAAPAQGWGSYLASWVYPTTAPPAATASTLTTTEPSVSVASQEEDSPTAVELDNPVEDQKPVAEDETSRAAPSEPEIELPPDEPPRTAPPSPPPPKLAASTASTSGWLSYLAFRASQKRVTASTKTLDDTRPDEEVMDFEGDPDFPQSTDGSLSKATGAALSREASHSKATGANLSRQVSLSQATGKGAAPPAKAASGNLSRQPSFSANPAAKGVGSQSKATGASGKGKPSELKLEDRRDSAAAASVQSQPTQKLGHKRSQNLSAGRSRRLSNASSTRSAASTPQPTSPKLQSNGHSATKSGSDLPAPPRPPSKQPNFIIPTFDITFDRPPRSLLPRNSEPAGAAGLALRAFSYVYNTQPVDPPEEKRGKKEGRDVGANLPRRIGLGGGSPDDGWRDVRRVVVIGVHGWFPAKMLTSVIGEPTGTSTKFANMMGEAVRKFFASKGVDDSEVRLTLIPLEGEGTIEHRVDKLYKQYLSNPAWINDLRRADAILFAAHSQGCIVTTHLISRMIAQGHIRTSLNREAVARCEWAFGPIGIVPSEDSKKGRQLVAQMSGHDGGRQKVCMLAMCGVHLGPFYSISTSSVIQPYLQWFENAAARELFEFQDSTSAVSLAYQRALAMVLENEVRVLLLSSLNDQVVPIYGASFATASHPLLMRALYVDGASYSASDFMTNLLCFAFMLRNAGIDDQRLIEHLSEATAGSLTGVGHSTPYEELGCYSLAVQYLFYAGPAAQPLPPLEIDAFAARDARNDFELPWIMRALVDSPEVKDLFPDELRTLKDNILAWKPNTKALKEIKKRLEPMAGRQRLSPLSQLAKSGSSTSLASMNPATSSPAAPGVAPGTAHAQSHANSIKKKPTPAPKAVMTMVGR